MMNHLQCREAMHNAERAARNAAQGNPFTLAVIDQHLASAEAAYMSDQCEPRIAQRLHVAMDMIGQFAQQAS